MEIDMDNPVVKPGDKLHIATRRLFPGDVRRHFVGTVSAVEGALIRVEGFAFILHPGTNEYERRPNLRQRIISLADGTQVVHAIPEAVDVARLQYSFVQDRLVLSDGEAFSLDIHEFGPSS